MMTPNTQTIMLEPHLIVSVGGGSRFDLLQEFLVTTITILSERNKWLATKHDHEPVLLGETCTMIFLTLVQIACIYMDVSTLGVTHQTHWTHWTHWTHRTYWTHHTHWTQCTHYTHAKSYPTHEINDLINGLIDLWTGRKPSLPNG